MIFRIVILNSIYHNFNRTECILIVLINLNQERALSEIRVVGLIAAMEKNFHPVRLARVATVFHLFYAT